MLVSLSLCRRRTAWTLNFSLQSIAFNGCHSGQKMECLSAVCYYFLKVLNNMAKDLTRRFYSRCPDFPRRNKSENVSRPSVLISHCTFRISLWFSSCRGTSWQTADKSPHWLNQKAARELLKIGLGKTDWWSKNKMLILPNEQLREYRENKKWGEGKWPASSVSSSPVFRSS